MSPATQMILSGALTFGVPLIFAVREVIGSRSQGGSPRSGPGPLPPHPRGPLGPTQGRKPLPACLLPPYPDRLVESQFLDRIPEEVD